jgi:hypothetical protein
MSLDDSLRFQIQTALGDAGFEFRTMHVGDSVTIDYRDSLPCRLTYHLDMANGYVVELDSGCAVARLETHPVDTTASAIRGVVNGSLWESMIGSGADPHLVAAFCEVLRSQVRFPDDVERGDTFGLVVERFEVDGSFYRFGDILLVRYAGQRVSGFAFLFRPESGAGFYADVEGRSLYRLLDYPPVQNARRTSDFGPRMHPFRRRRINHSGLDYAAPFGTPVRAIADGTIARRGWLGGYGRSIDLRQADSDLSSRYAHLCRYAPGTAVGSRVRRGQVVGYVGSTGMSTGFHLDFGIRRAGKPVDPLKALPSGYRRVPPEMMAGFLAEMNGLRSLLESARDPQRPDQAAAEAVEPQ